MIEIKNLIYEYKNKKTGRVLDNLNLIIKDNEKHAILGINGAGKSTLIKLLIGVLSPTSGEVIINGINPWKNRIEFVQNIGVVWGQRSTLWWDIPVIDSFKSLMKIYNIPKSNFEIQLDFAEKHFELSKFWNRPLRTLSLGQRVRCDIMAALLHSPRILFFDEPFLGLDFFARRSIVEALKTMYQTRQFTLILTSHHLMDVEDLTSCMTVLQKGKIKFSGMRSNLPLNKLTQSHLLVRKKENSPIKINSSWIDSLKVNISNVDENNRFEIRFNKNEISEVEIANEVLKNNEIISLEFLNPSLEEQLSDLINSRF